MEVVPGLYHIPGMRRANAYLVQQDTLTLVDAGLPGDNAAILKAIESLDRELVDLDQIIVTHHHADHCGSLAALRSATGARVLAHAADAPYICGDLARPLPNHWILRPFFRLLRSRSHGGGVEVDCTLSDGEQLPLLEGATVIHLPGHSPGSIALHFPSERILISGDAVLVHKGRPTPPPRFFSQDPAEAMTAIRRLAMLDFEILCPGHGEPIMGGATDKLKALLD